jgi:hypothetical protein
MNIRERLIKEIEQMPEEQLQQVLEFVRSLEDTEQEYDDEAWQAYLKSEQRREEVYRRLANS